jgi:hypothetical protein
MIRLSNKRLSKPVSNGLCRPPGRGERDSGGSVEATSPVLGEKYKRDSADLDWRDKRGK